MSSVMTKNELVLVIAGGLFVLEAISVIVQVLSFKLILLSEVFIMNPSLSSIINITFSNHNFCLWLKFFNSSYCRSIFIRWIRA